MANALTNSDAVSFRREFALHIGKHLCHFLSYFFCNGCFRIWRNLHPLKYSNYVLCSFRRIRSSTRYLSIQETTSRNWVLHKTKCSEILSFEVSSHAVSRVPNAAVKFSRNAGTFRLNCMTSPSFVVTEARGSNFTSVLHYVSYKTRNVYKSLTISLLCTLHYLPQTLTSNTCPNLW